MLLGEIFEGYWKDIDIKNKERPPVPVAKPKPQKFYVMINGKIWKKDGKPVDFTSHEAAKRTADTITARYNKVTQVVPG